MGELNLATGKKKEVRLFYSDRGGGGGEDGVSIGGGVFLWGQFFWGGEGVLLSVL